MKLSKKNYNQSNCFLSTNCIKEWIPAIEANKKVFEFKKGEVLFNEGDLVEGMYFVYEGCVKVHKRWGDKELILRFATQGSILGHRGLSTTNNNYPISATAIEDGAVSYISMDFFNSTLKVNPNFTYKLLMFFADELQLSERKMRNLAHLSVKGRVAQSLINLKDQFGIDDAGVLTRTITRQDLASYAGATYETVFRMINELKEEKVVEINGKEMRILDLGKLVNHTLEEIVSN